MKLHLIRHAKTDPLADSGKDFDRKLLPKGIIQSNVLGYYLLDHIEPIHITYCSTAVRTKETLSILQKITQLEKIHFDDELYLCDREKYLSIIWDLEHDKDIMFIGHNDGISDLAMYFLDEMIYLKTCEYLCLEFNAESWKETSKGTGKLSADFHPKVYFPD